MGLILYLIQLITLMLQMIDKNARNIGFVGSFLSKYSQVIVGYRFFDKRYFENDGYIFDQV